MLHATTPGTRGRSSVSRTTRCSMPKTRSTYNRKRAKPKYADPVEESDILIDKIERTQILPDHISNCTVQEELAAKIQVCFVCEHSLLKNGNPFTKCFACQSQSHLKCNASVSDKEITYIYMKAAGNGTAKIAK